MNKKLLQVCRVYKGEAANPIDKAKDEFKWQMWRIERHAVQTINGSNEDENEEAFKEEIKCAIFNYADEPFGGDPAPYIKRYFAY